MLSAPTPPSDVEQQMGALDRCRGAGEGLEPSPTAALPLALGRTVTRQGRRVPLDGGPAGAVLVAYVDAVLRVVDQVELTERVLRCALADERRFLARADLQTPAVDV